MGHRYTLSEECTQKMAYKCNETTCLNTCMHANTEYKKGSTQHKNTRQGWTEKTHLKDQSLCVEVAKMYM